MWWPPIWPILTFTIFFATMAIAAVARHRETLKREAEGDP
jgi:hypothetical protein